jgi:type II secretory pathway component PulF
MPNIFQKRSRFTVLLLVACVLMFATYLKIVPDLPRAYSSATNAATHLWVDGDHKSDTRTKLALVCGIILFFLQFFTALRIVVSRQRVIVAAKQSHDIFAESWHWFRPPPLS